MIYIPNYHFYRINRQPGRKGRTAVAVRKGIPHKHADLPPLISVEAEESAYLLITVKFCLQLFIKLQEVPGVSLD
jgi:hypothetical protein